MTNPNPKDIAAARRLLADIQVDRDYPGPGRKSKIPKKKIGGFTVSAGLAEALDNLPRPASHHVERALKLYLMLVKKD